MPLACSAIGCTQRDTPESREEGISFHMFPLHEETRRAWIIAVRRKDWEPTRSTFLCSKHFRESDCRDSTSIRLLKRYVVPSKFEAFPTYYQVPSPKKRRVLYRDQGKTNPESLLSANEEVEQM